MTIPTERTRALLYARDFLYSLLDPKQTPRVPRAIRREAGNRLRHYPAPYEIAKIPTKDSRLWFENPNG